MAFKEEPSHRVALLSLVFSAAIFSVRHAAGLAPDLALFADVLGILCLVIAVAAPVLRHLHRWLRLRIHPTPGSRPLPGELRIPEALAIDRGTIAFSMVPPHAARARPARMASLVDFGDAAFVLSRQQETTLRWFIGRPAGRLDAARSTSPAARDVLIVTGEPGGGKSVLLQEIQASLALGVEGGNHGFVPLIVFARDLQLDVLRIAATDMASPMRAFLSAYYERRAKAFAGEELLGHLRNLIAFHWDRTDFLIIIDGLDEIPQRSSYEDVQRVLAELIAADLKVSVRCVHRYVLSCRVDEDLELFPDALNIRLRGLDETQRSRLCRAMLGDAGLDRQGTAMLAEALSSPRLVPSHVFQRNPYFLALLVSHLREDHDRVRDQTLDFDYLMRKYLERESQRPFAMASAGRSTIEARRTLFAELEPVARPALQSMAFRSATSAQAGALYDEVTIDQRMIEGFLADIPCRPAGGSPVTNLWSALAGALDRLTAPDGTGEMAASAIYALPLTHHFNESEIRLLESVAAKLRAGPIDPGTLLTALGTLPYRSGVEPEAWYAALAEHFSALAGAMSLNGEQALATVLFFRSICAAHVLRVLYLTVTDGRARLRFRHRRLAEYYAACYCRDRWDDIAPQLTFSPWLSPVLNLTAALEGAQCRVLAWLVQSMGAAPTEPYYRWRYTLEAAVEASFFANPGAAYTAAVEALTERIVMALEAVDGKAVERAPSKARRERGAPIFAVTRIALLRALEQMAALRKTLSAPLESSAIASRFYAYAGRNPAEWIDAVLPAVAAVETLTGTKCSRSVKQTLRWGVIQNPSGILAPGTGVRMPQFERSLVIATTSIGELLFASGLWFALLFPFLLITLGSGADSASARDAVLLFSGIAAVALIVVRSAKWARSPTSATFNATFVWRAPQIVRAFVDSGAGHERLRRSAIRSLQFLALWVLVSGGLIGLAWAVYWLAMPSRDDVYAASDRIRADFTRRIEEVVEPHELDDLQRDLGRQVNDLAEANEGHWGRGTADGGFIAEEDWILDQLYDVDPRLVPAAREEDRFSSGEDAVRNLQRLLNEPLPMAPPAGMIGALAAVRQRFRVSDSIGELKAARAEVREARRHGWPVDRELVEKLFAEVERALESRAKLLAGLKVRNGATLLFGALLLLALGLLLFASWVVWQRSHDRVALTRMAALADVESLCDCIADAGLSERVRIAAIKRLDEIGVRREEEIDLIERRCGLLLAQGSAVDRNMGVRLARLTRALSNRLRHRLSNEPA